MSPPRRPPLRVGSSRRGADRSYAPDGREVDLPYDTLVVAAGATHSYFGKDYLAEFAPGMKTVEDARYLRWCTCLSSTRTCTAAR